MHLRSFGEDLMDHPFLVFVAPSNDHLCQALFSILSTIINHHNGLFLAVTALKAISRLYLSTIITVYVTLIAVALALISWFPSLSTLFTMTNQPIRYISVMNINDQSLCTIGTEPSPLPKHTIHVSSQLKFFQTPLRFEK